MFKGAEEVRPAQDGGGRGPTLGAPCWVGDREEAFSLTLDFYEPVLFATERKEKSDRGVLVHGPPRGRPPSPWHLLVSVRQALCLSLSLPAPGTGPAWQVTLIADTLRAPALCPLPAACAVIQPISQVERPRLSGLPKINAWRWTPGLTHGTLAPVVGYVITGPTCPSARVLSDLLEEGPRGLGPVALPGLAPFLGCKTGSLPAMRLLDRQLQERQGRASLNWSVLGPISRCVDLRERREVSTLEPDSEQHPVSS